MKRRAIGSIFAKVPSPRIGHNRRPMELSIATALRFPAFLRRVSRFALDMALPPRCLLCNEEQGDAGALCAACWRKVTFLAQPCCACCGLPFTFEMGPEALCASCSRKQPSFARARAAFRYDDDSKKLVLSFKHGDRLHLAPAFGGWMRRSGEALLADADMLVPVPLHWTRLFKRRYNQAAVLARAIHKAGGPPVAVDWLVRRKRTPSQGRLNAANRMANVKRAFGMRKGHEAEGKRIVLIDDVLTTGATVEECARVLKRAGAARVDVLTLSRVVRREDG